MKLNKKILAVLMQWDYCDKRRGVSGDKRLFFYALSKVAAEVEPFWYDDYINDPEKLRRLVYEKAEDFNPDLIFWPSYTDQFDPASLDKLKARWPTCGWFGDDNWRFDNYSSRLAPHFTHVCTTDIFSVEKYRKLGIEPILTQWAWQVLGVPGAPLPSGSKFRYDVAFVGGYNQVRGWFVKTLARHGIKVECFGHGWKNGMVGFEEMERVFRESRISLNLSNSVSRDIRFVLGSPMNFARFLCSPKNVEQMKGRNFEIPLVGGFQLTNYVAGIERYFKIGEEVAVYADPEDCARQIHYYLKNEEERVRIAVAGQARAAREHTYVRRFEDIFRRIFK